MRRRPIPPDMSARRRRRKSASTPEEQVARLMEIGERAYRAGIYASLEHGLEAASVSLVLHGPDGAFSYRADMGNMFGQGDTPDEALDGLAAHAEGLADDIRQGIRNPARGWDYEDDEDDY